MNFYHPSSRHRTDSDLIEAWGRDYGLTLLEVMNLSAGERREALEALRSLAIWWSEPVEKEPDNPYWMEDEGYIDSDKDTKVLARIARSVFDRRPE
ncbi:hypothetical protein LBMAG57_33250 [Verrucomicrobiota bacterium]|nr:hypothetical protein LBMAG57_33250 [Verrucomicrobiota bacterium]